MKTPTFPCPVKRGSATVTIYKTETHGYESFIVYYRSAGKAHRATFPDFKSAKEEAWTKAGQLDCGKGAVLSMSSEDRAAYLEAKRQLRDCGVSVQFAASQFAEMKKILGDLSPNRSGQTGGQDERCCQTKFDRPRSGCRIAQRP